MTLYDCFYCEYFSQGVACHLCIYTNIKRSSSAAQCYCWGPMLKDLLICTFSKELMHQWASTCAASPGWPSSCLSNWKKQRERDDFLTAERKICIGFQAFQAIITLGFSLILLPYLAHLLSHTEVNTPARLMVNKSWSASMSNLEPKLWSKDLYDACCFRHVLDRYILQKWVSSPRALLQK